MSKILQNIKKNAEMYSQRIAYSVGTQRLSWGELGTQSDKLANYLNRVLKKKTPIVVYGHKNPHMLVLFLACVKTGRAYVPIDSSFPIGRIQDILDEVQPEIFLATEDISGVNLNCNFLMVDEIEKIILEEESVLTSEYWVNPEDVFYIIFTSGSTGTPKGVQITSECLDNFITWAVTLGEPKNKLDDGNEHIFINQAPFSFDLSVFDLYLSLYVGGTLCAIPKSLQGDTEKLYDYLKETNADVWVSTPSFAELVLSDEKFSEQLMPKLKLFLFCGETLTNQTVQRLQEAFHTAEIINTYGPTESTVAMTSVHITPDIMDAYNPLPIGVAKPGTYVYIMDEAGNILPDGEKGEIVIVGNTVSIGYWNNPEKSAEVFGTKEIEGKTYRLYHTRDKGYYKDNMLFYCGRIDLQIKLHGYRIELEDIESNILMYAGVERVVILPEYKDGKVINLIAYIVPKNKIESNLKERQRIREELKKRIPEYMIPKKFVFRESLPVTANGKVDRRKLEELETCSE